LFHISNKVFIYLTTRTRARAHTHTHVSFRKDSRKDESFPVKYNPMTSECKIHFVEVDLHYFK